MLEDRPAPIAARLAFAAAAALLLGACSMAPTVTGRSSIEQRLLSRSLERAVAELDVTGLAGKRVAVDLLALTADKDFAKAFVAAQLRRRGVLIADDAKDAEVKLQVFASALAVDQGETLIGIPQVVIPLVGVPIPEIALFKWTRHRGITEVRLYAHDGRDGRAIEDAPIGFGRARYDQFTVLILIRFSRDDLEEPSPTARRAR